MIIVTIHYNDEQTVKDFVRSVENYDCIKHIILVDNCSCENSYKEISKLVSDKVDIIKTDKNGGYGYGNNYGVKFAKEKYGSKFAIICNPDVRFDEVVVQKLHMLMIQNNDIGVAAPIMKNRGGIIEQGTAWRIPSGWDYVFSSVHILNKLAKNVLYDLNNTNKRETLNVDCVAGSMLMVNVDAFNECGGYDEGIFLYCEETVLGIKMKKYGRKTKLLLNNYFLHFHSVSIAKNIKSLRNRKKMMWNSRKYVLKKYYEFKQWQLIIVALIEKGNYILDDFLGVVAKQKRRRA